MGRSQDAHILGFLLRECLLILCSDKQTSKEPFLSLTLGGNHGDKDLDTEASSKISQFPFIQSAYLAEVPYYGVSISEPQEYHDKM